MISYKYDLIKELSLSI